MNNLKREQKLLLVLALVLILAVISYRSIRANQRQEDIGFILENTTENSEISVSEPIIPSNQIGVHIEGAVAVPGVYFLNVESRVHDLVEMAGGLSVEADPLGINLARKLQDEDFIYVRKIGEEISDTLNLEGTHASSSDGLVNINRGTQAELMQLKGIGEAYANRIIEYRNTHGDFQSIEEITQISGIGPVTFENIKDSITVSP